jgi:hypothetical protein
MNAHVALVVLAFSSLATATDQWQPTLATVAALRTAGAHIMSTDALPLERGRIALITYWEVRSETDLDVYRCVDIVNSDMEGISHECRKVLRPTGRLSQQE